MWGILFVSRYLSVTTTAFACYFFATVAERQRTKKTTEEVLHDTRHDNNWFLPHLLLFQFRTHGRRSEEKHHDTRTLLRKYVFATVKVFVVAMPIHCWGITLTLLRHTKINTDMPTLIFLVQVGVVPASVAWCNVDGSLCVT